MKKFFEIIIVIPVGPGTELRFLRDTIESLIYYTESTYKIVVADDSQQGLGDALKPDFELIDVICTKKSSGTMGGFYITLSKIYSHLLEKYDFTLLMKLDTDALIIGPAPERTALSFFKEQPMMAIAGQYPLEYDGSSWDYGWPRARIINATMTWKFVRRPMANIVLRNIYLRALRNGYLTGESVFGGSSYHSRIFLQKLQAEHLLPNALLSTLNLGEDHIFSLLAKTCGMQLGSLSSEGLPFACTWKGLPASPQELYARGKKVIHSTRKWADMDEVQIRSFFRSKRLSKTASPAISGTGFQTL